MFVKAAPSWPCQRGKWRALSLTAQTARGNLSHPRGVGISPRSNCWRPRPSKQDYLTPKSSLTGNRQPILSRIWGSILECKILTIFILNFLCTANDIRSLISILFIKVYFIIIFVDKSTIKVESFPIFFSSLMWRNECSALTG